MSDPTYLKDLKKWGAEDPTVDDLEALESELYAGSDRGAAVIFSSVVEKSLGKLLRDAMRPDGIGNLFEFDGTLGTFGAKIQFAYALQLIGPITRHDLTIIRSLRNQFAHSRRPIEFETPVVAAACKHLSLPDQLGVFLSYRMLQAVPEDRLLAASDKNHPRTRFFTAGNEIAQRIYFIRTGDKNDPLNQLP